MKTQDQVANTFTKPLKYNVFIKMRDMFGVMKKASSRGVLKVNQISFLKNRGTGLLVENQLTSFNKLNWSTNSEMVN